MRIRERVLLPRPVGVECGYGDGFICHLSLLCSPVRACKLFFQCSRLCLQRCFVGPLSACKFEVTKRSRRYGPYRIALRRVGSIDKALTFYGSMSGSEAYGFP